MEGYASASAPRHTSRDRARVSPDNPSRLLPSICGHRRCSEGDLGDSEDPRSAPSSSGPRAHPAPTNPLPNLQSPLDLVTQREQRVVETILRIQVKSCSGPAPLLRPKTEHLWSSSRANDPAVRGAELGRLRRQFKTLKKQIRSSSPCIENVPLSYPLPQTPCWKKFLLFQFWSAPLQELHSDGEEYFGVATGGERGENGSLAGGSQIGSENPKKR